MTPSCPPEYLKIKRRSFDVDDGVGVVGTRIVHFDFHHLTILNESCCGGAGAATLGINNADGRRFTVPESRIQHFDVRYKPVINFGLGRGLFKFAFPIIYNSKFELTRPVEGFAVDRNLPLIVDTCGNIGGEDRG